MGVGSSPDVRYQVFVSSTFLDLKEAREEVIQAILELDCFPAGMELFPAANDEKWDLIKSVIDDSDYYVLIVGGRYGSVDEDGVSFTEKEYDYAIETSTPVLAFLHSDPDGLPKRDTEAEAAGTVRLNEFRRKVEERMCKFWQTPAELGSVVSRSLIKTMKATPANGWVRADQAMTADQVVEIEQLRRQIAEFQVEHAGSGAAPSDTDDFSQGSDQVELGYSFEAGTSQYYAVEYTADGAFTWDEIFAVVGPAMFDEASERAMRELIDNLIREKQWEQNLKEVSGDDGDVRLYSFTIDQDSFNVVKVQLVALQLIEKSSKRHGINDKNTYWSLTRYGEQYVMRLKAQRRS